MIELPSEFLSRMKNSLGGEYESFLASYNLPAEKGIRVNTLKISPEKFKEISPVPLGENIPWTDCGFYTSGEGHGKTVFHAAGLYYVQEPSSMSVAPKLEVKAGERVLDLCSAPGGKGTQLAALLNAGGCISENCGQSNNERLCHPELAEGSIIFLNEINPKRAEILSQNVERMGVENAVVTCASPDTLADALPNYFDKILVDAPCSGEGMFKKEETAIPEWSLENVKACAQRQQKILESADILLANGGKMAYSTCTFAPEEDEEQIQRFLSLHTNYKLIEMRKLLPHRVRGEGHFYAVLEKTDGEKNDVRLMRVQADKSALNAFESWKKGIVYRSFKNIHRAGDTLYALPDGMPDINIRMLRAGIRLGEIKNNRFEPSHSLAMCLKCGEYNSVDVDEETAIKYLRGLTFECSADNGWKIVTFSGYPLGWCKIVSGTAKNHLPKGLRI